MKAFIFAIFISVCFPIKASGVLVSNIQTAKALKPHVWEQVVFFSRPFITNLRPRPAMIENRKTVTFNEIAWFIQTGLAEKLDISINTSALFKVDWFAYINVVLNLKYKLLEESNYLPALAVNIGSGVILGSGAIGLIDIFPLITGRLIIGKELRSFNFYLGEKVNSFYKYNYTGPFGGCQLKLSSKLSLIGEVSYIEGKSEYFSSFGLGIVYRK